MSKRTLVGISTYRNIGHLEVLLQSIRWSTYLDDPEFDIVVCDDGTKSFDHPIAQKQYESTVEACAKFGATLIEHDKNYGIPTAWNHLANSLGAQSENIIILNDDLTMPPDWIKTMVHFLDTNKDNKHVGSAYWLPIQPVDLEMQRVLLPRLGHTLFRFTDQVTGKDIVSKHPSDWGIPSTNNVGDDHGLGRVMCMIGCCFGFRREVWNEIGPFDERMTSFHEESDWGTRCAIHGKAAIALPYPKPYHAHSATFSANPELQATPRMIASRALYREKYNVPSEVGPDDYFNYMNRKLMPQIPDIELKYLRPDYTLPPVERHQPGGEIVKTPALVECTQVLGRMEGVPQ